VADLQDLIMLLFLLQVTPVQEVLKFIVKYRRRTNLESFEAGAAWNKTNRFGGT
jgi:hypothetical protein